jgi:crotonobetainyl-CoA:carnitine CoA-transferase CaiB-like acyl-CoA transferase
VAGILPIINGGTKEPIYQFPTNFLADFVATSLGITATLSALAVSKKTGVGRVVDCAMTESARYFAQIIREGILHQKAI